MKLRIAAAVLLLASAVPAAAQDDRGAAIGGSVSATDMDDRTSLSFTGLFDFSFTRVVGFEIETTAVPTLKSEFPRGPVQILEADGSFAAVLQIYPGPRYENNNGRAVILLNNVRVAIPTTATRVEPYFVAGGGIAHVRHEADLVYTYPPLPLSPNMPALVPRTFTQHVEASEIDLALTLGGGVGVKLAPKVWVDADLRLIRLMGDTDRNAGRFGVGIRYRF